MFDDTQIRNQVINKLVAEVEVQMPPIPSDLRQSYDRAGGWTGLLGGVLVGTKLGAGVGLAMGPLGAIAGTVPGAVIGGALGYFGGKGVGGKFEKG